MNLRGKKVLVTGGAQRIGREICLGFARRGADVSIHYLRSARKAETLANEIRSLGVESRTYRADLSDLASLRRMTSRVLKETGGVDILINNAAIFYPTPFKTVKEAEWDDFISVNLKAPFFLAQAFGSVMKRRGGGRIVNIADWSALRPYRDFLPYCISKAGLIALTQGLAKTLAPEVLVTAVCPGPILPPRGATGRRREEIVGKNLVGRWGRSEEVVKTILFLAESDFITGSSHLVDGGQFLK